MKIEEFEARIADLHSLLLAQMQGDCREEPRISLTINGAKELLSEIHALQKSLCRAREGLGHQTNIGCMEEDCDNCLHWLSMKAKMYEEVK